MNISRINSTAFRGTLAIVYDEKNGNPCIEKFKTEDIEAIVERPGIKSTFIYGKSKKRPDFRPLEIPFREISPEKIMAAYSASCQNDKISVQIASRTTKY